MEGDLCLPLFERLKSIQRCQEEFNYSYTALLQKLKKNMANDDRELQDYKQNDLSMKKISSFNSECEETINNQNSKNINICHPDANSSQKTSGELSRVFSNMDNLQPNNQENSTSNKFAYLKKRQGLSRYNYKICKGFKKKNADFCPATKTKTSSEIGVIKSDIHKKLQTGKQSTFEKLEEMVERDSFCSTSPEILGLLEESLSSHLSPISSRVSFSSKESTVIKENNLNSRYYWSPVKRIFSNKTDMPQLCNKELTSFEQIKNSRTFVNKKLLSSSEKCILGILKKNGSNSSTPLCSPKVKFLEHEVKVLEYEKDENLTNSDDTDLLSSSDLENLPLIDTVSNHFPVKNILPFKICKESQIISDDNLTPMFCEGKFEIGNKQASEGIYTEKESLQMKSHKMLLLAKVSDLVREIKIFKEKNKYLEELIFKEKQKFLNQYNVKETSLAVPKACILKSKLEDSSHPSNDNALTNISFQLQKLNQKLLDLERENKLLKKKVEQLEKRKTILRNQHENSLIKHCEISYSSQNKISKAAVKKKVQKARPSIHLNEKQSIDSASMTPTVEDKPDSCFPERLSSLRDIRDIYGISDNATVEKKINRPEAPEDINNPLIRSEFDLKFSVNEEIKGTHKGTVSRNFTSKEKNTSIRDNNAKENYSLAVDGKNISHNVQSSKATTELHNNILVKSSNEDRMFKQCVVKNENRICDDYKVSCFGKCDLPNTEGEMKYITYPNGDKEIIYSNKKIYHYAINNSIRTTFIDEGKEEIKFSNGQREIYYSNGTFEVTFPDMSSKTVYGDGSENLIYQDGTKVHINKDKTKVIHFSNGQKEIYKNDCTCRVYPDGTIKILYKDGSKETRYISGKIHFKCADGSVHLEGK